MTHQKCVILRLMYWLGTVKWRLGRGSFWGWGSLLRFVIFWISCCSLLFAVFLLEKGNKNLKKINTLLPTRIYYLQFYRNFIAINSLKIQWQPFSCKFLTVCILYMKYSFDRIEVELTF